MSGVARNEIEARRRAAAELRFAGLDEEANVLDDDAARLDALTPSDIRRLEIRRTVAVNVARFWLTMAVLYAILREFGLVG